VGDNLDACLIENGDNFLGHDIKKERVNSLVNLLALKAQSIGRPCNFLFNCSRRTF
jgi:hypothetical protein